jgi:hypothetical protein
MTVAFFRRGWHERHDLARAARQAGSRREEGRNKDVSGAWLAFAVSRRLHNSTMGVDSGPRASVVPDLLDPDSIPFIGATLRVV